MPINFWCSLAPSALLVYSAMPHIALSQVIRVQPWTNTITQICALEDGGNLAAAAELAEEMVAKIERSDPGNILLPGAVDRLASLRHDQGDYTEAKQLYEEAVELWRGRPDSPNIGLATELNNLASFYSELGQVKNAESLRRQSLAIRLRLLGPASSEAALCYSNLAVDVFHQGRDHEAEELANQAIEIWRQGPPERSQIDLAYNTLATIGLHGGQYSSALKNVQLALQAYDQHGKKSAVRLAGYQHTLALAERYTGDMKGAAQAFQRSLATIAEAHVTLSVQRILVLQDYAALLRSTGQKREARKLKEQAAKELTQVSKGNPFKYSVDVNALLSSEH
jgi:tetratricopeptide (TPR) repeat protein